MTEHSAIASTPAAQRWLTHTQHARVINVFERACNLVNEHGEVLALVTVARAMTPFALQVNAASFADVAPADRVSVAGDDLCVGPLRIRTGEATVWNPVPDWEAISCALAADPTHLAHLADITLMFGQPGSLLAVFEGTESNPTVDRARRGAHMLIEGLRTNSLPQCLEGVNILAGLGGGLTPAGDDFICGALFAAWAGLLQPFSQRERTSLAQLLWRAQPLLRRLWGEDELSSIADHAASRTTTLSAAYLRAAARGECMALWHNLFAALCDDDRDLRSAIGELLAVGHTSGADALAGFIAAQLWHAPVAAHHL